MMGASGKGRVRRGAQAERAAPDLAEADLTEEQATPAHRHCVPHEPATTFIRGLQPVLQGPVT